MKLYHKILPLLLFSMLIGFNSYATHLMGGSFTYEYLGRSGSDYLYKLKIQMFRDCTSSTPFDNRISVGIYYDNATKSRLRTETMTLTSSNNVDPPSGGSNCSFDPNVCVQRGYYEKTIALPASSYGFHLLHQRCCRNTLVNLDQNMGQSYYAFIPPHTYKNNSPTFSGIPTPYICANDTVSISYGATDIDGDSLVYTFVHPYGGGSDVDPAPIPSDPLSLPITNVSYASSYSELQPFGSSGYTSINPQTGLVKLLVPSAGYWAIAVEVLEYRKGTLLSRIRRDIELIVLTCPVNDIPKLRKPSSTSFVIEEGEKLEFTIKYTDSDSMYMSREGDIFGGSGSSMTAPYAVLNTVDGESAIKTVFSWQTSCSHGRNNPYFFTLTVKDNGCPQKTKIDIFSIKVNPFLGPDSISGPRNVCEYDSFVTYKVYGISNGSLINWTVQGGSIVSGQGSDSVVVHWDQSGNGVLRAYETSSFGCGPEGVSFLVNIQPRPYVNAGSDVQICSRDTILLGDTLGDTSTSYFWFPNHFLNDATSPTPSFTYLNIGDTQAVFKLYLRATNKNGCYKVDSVIVTVNPEPDTFTIIGPEDPCFMGTFSYGAQGEAGSVFNWIVEGGSQVSGGSSDKIDIHWTDSFSGKIYVIETNLYSCMGDTSKKDVVIVRPLANIKGPDVVCPNTVNVKYWSVETKGSIYSWNVINGQRVGSGNGSEIAVNWPDSGQAMITLVETTKEGCVSDSLFFPVLISYRLKTSPIGGDTNICAFTTGEPYNVLEVNGSTYQWFVDRGILNQGNGSASIDVDWGPDGLGMLKVLETSYDSVNQKECIGDTVYQPVVLNPLPLTSPISGNLNVCEYDTFSYFVSGFDSSVFIWTIDDASISFDGQYTDHIEVYWETEGTYKISVYELTKDSCTDMVVDTTVHVHPLPETSDIIGDSAICFPGNSVSYRVDGFQNSQFNWSVDNGNITDGNGLSLIDVDWIIPPEGKVRVQEISEWGCIGDVISEKVIIDSLGPDMRLVTTNIDNDEIIEVYWGIVNDHYFDRKASLYKNKANFRSWQIIDSFPKTVTSYVDKQVETHETPYDYMIAVKNICNNRFESEIHRSVFLTGYKGKSFDIHLSWNEYQGWGEHVDRYDIYRKVDEETAFRMYQSAGKDSAIDLKVGIDGRNQCYRVVAVKGGGELLESWSNETCFEFEPVLYVPNAFTPNEDGVNDTFSVHAYNLATFKMSIYDRWGEQVFSTNTPKEGWDGTFKGMECPLGVYVVIIYYTGNTPNRSYVGNITLIR